MTARKPPTLGGAGCLKMQMHLIRTGGGPRERTRARRKIS